MSPRAQRSQPLHQQIADWFTERIVAGEPGYREDDKLPPIRDIARGWDVGYQAAQRAYELLASARLVESRGKAGTFVLPPRNAVGPQQRMRAGHLAESAEVRAASLMPADGPYAYVRPILGLARAVSHVIRREQLLIDASGPFMLAVSWLPPHFAKPVPELLQREALPDPRGAAHLVAARTARRLDYGRSAREARPARKDGREDVLLGLEPGDYVLAETYTWLSDGKVIEYGEFVVRPGRVIESDMEP